jgi:hypothetical protein
MPFFGVEAGGGLFEGSHSTLTSDDEKPHKSSSSEDISITSLCREGPGLSPPLVLVASESVN